MIARDSQPNTHHQNAISPLDNGEDSQSSNDSGTTILSDSQNDERANDDGQIPLSMGLTKV